MPDSALPVVQAADYSGLVIGLVMATVPLVIANWPRVVAFMSERRATSAHLPAGLTPFAAAELSGLKALAQLVAGLMWIIARGTGGTSLAGATAASAAVGASAENSLRESLSQQESPIEDAFHEAMHLVDDHGTTHHELRTVMVGLRDASRHDGRNLGLLRDSRRIAIALLGLAATEMLLAFLVDIRLPISDALALSSVLTCYIALHVDPHSFAGAQLTGELRRLRTDLRKAALATGTIDTTIVQSAAPAVSGRAEAEVWALAVGCHTTGSERVSSRLYSLLHAEEGRPMRIRYSEQVLMIGASFSDRLAARVGRAGSKRLGSDGSPVPLW
jgi:hypothetical protein